MLISLPTWTASSLAQPGLCWARASPCQHQHSTQHHVSKSQQILCAGCTVLATPTPSEDPPAAAPAAAPEAAGEAATDLSDAAAREAAPERMEGVEGELHLAAAWATSLSLPSPIVVSSLRSLSGFTCNASQKRTKGARSWSVCLCSASACLLVDRAQLQCPAHLGASLNSSRQVLATSVCVCCDVNQHL